MLQSAERELKEEYDAPMSHILTTNLTFRPQLRKLAYHIVFQSRCSKSPPWPDGKGPRAVSLQLSQSICPYKHMRNHGSRYRSSYAPTLVLMSSLTRRILQPRTPQLLFSFHTFPDHIPVIKRMRTTAFPALALISVCMLLG
jgi:hypothetical protein